MQVKTFRAATMRQALEMVRRDLGPQAAVLHTREVRPPALFRWLGRSRAFEVTASTDVPVPSRLPSRLHQPAEAPAARGPAHPAAPNRQQLLDELQGQLGQLKALVSDLCQQSAPAAQRPLPDQLFRLFTDLIDAEVDEELARELVEELRHEVPPHELNSPEAVKGLLARRLEREIRVQGPLQVTPSRRRLVALVGATGVGKTTTIAKLAANYRLREKRNVGLITVDTYRIAAVEQLRTYADIIDLPMEVVSTPRQMREAAARMAHLDLVLMDTAGRSPRDEVKIQELKAFLNEAEADEIHLVLSSTGSPSSLIKTVQRFQAVGVTALLLTKLDEAAGLGNVLPLLRATRLPLSYVTCGQNVPDDIEAASAGRLARLILGMETLHR